MIPSCVVPLVTAHFWRRESPHTGLAVFSYVIICQCPYSLLQQAWPSLQVPSGIVSYIRLPQGMQRQLKGTLSLLGAWLLIYFTLGDITDERPLTIVVDL